MMTKHCGLNKFWIFFVAALFCLTLAAPQSRADLFPPDATGNQDMRIGDDSCVLVNCAGVLSDGSINLIQGVWDEIEPLNITFFSGGNGGNLVSPILLIFAVPVENLLLNFGDPLAFGATNPLLDATQAGGDGVLDASLFLNYPVTWPGGPSSNVPFSLPDPLLDGTIFSAQGETWPGGDYDQGSVFDGLPAPESKQKIFDTLLGLQGANASTHFGNMANAAVTIPDIVICQQIPDPTASAACTAALIRPTGFTVWVYLLDTNEFGPGDNIHVDWRNIPIGTFAFSWGHNCSATAPEHGNENCVSSQALTESAFLMPLPCQLTGTCTQVPEPTSLLLLGTGLLFVGRQWRKRKA